MQSNQIGDEGASVLALNSTLKSLNLSYNNIRDKGARALAQSCCTLTCLRLDGNHIREEIKATVDQRISNNLAMQAQRRSSFIRCMVILSRDAAIRSRSTSYWSRLPSDLRHYVLWHLCRSYSSTFGKRSQQTYECAMFLMENVDTIN